MRHPLVRGALPVRGTTPGPPRWGVVRRGVPPFALCRCEVCCWSAVILVVRGKDRAGTVDASTAARHRIDHGSLIWLRHRSSQAQPTPTTSFSPRHSPPAPPTPPPPHPPPPF